METWNMVKDENLWKIWNKLFNVYLYMWFWSGWNDYFNQESWIIIVIGFFILICLSFLIFQRSWSWAIYICFPLWYNYHERWGITLLNKVNKVNEYHDRLWFMIKIIHFLLKKNRRINLINISLTLGFISDQEITSSSRGSREWKIIKKSWWRRRRFKMMRITGKEGGRRWWNDLKLEDKVRYW